MQFKGSSLILNGIKKISATQAKCLSFFGGKFLNLGGVISLTVIQAKYLSEFAGDILYLDRVVDITEGGLTHFLRFGGSCLHIAGMQFEKGKPVITHVKQITNRQINLISQYRYKKQVIFTNPIQLTDSQKFILETNGIDYKFSCFSVARQDHIKERIGNINVDENQMIKSQIKSITKTINSLDESKESDKYCSNLTSETIQEVRLGKYKMFGKYKAKNNNSPFRKKFINYSIKQILNYKIDNILYLIGVVSLAFVMYRNMYF